MLKFPTIIVLTIVQFAFFLLFAKGFFPQKVLFPGVNTFKDFAAESVLAQRLHEQTYASNEKASYDKLIFIVIDALRSDFVFSTNSSFAHLHELLNKNEAIGFTGFSNPPTVTLPRLKSITTGSISNFLDAILNINEDDTSSSSNLMGQDSWLLQFDQKMPHGINFFGDDTWLKLFPTMFQEYEGTSSFFVSDFTEVDNNVTRHIDAQLRNDTSWDGLILHYLGLDHIGHKNGPESVYMPQKQRELDEIIYKIYTEYVVEQYRAKGQKTLMVVLGDHGMNEIGNHGGSSVSETSAGLVFLSPEFAKCKSLHNDAKVPIGVNEDFQFLQSINQIDLIPTLCHFFNLPLPKNNIGVVINKFLEDSDFSTVLYRLLQNAYQLRHLLESKLGQSLSTQYDASRVHSSSSLFDELDALWHDSVLFTEADFAAAAAGSEAEKTRLVGNFYEFLRKTQTYLQNSSTNYDINLLMNCIQVLVCVAVLVVAAFVQSVIVELKVYKSGAFFLIFAVICGASTFASSMVEEEHQIWWFFSTVFALFASIALWDIKGIVKYTLVYTFCLRLVRFWNTSGQKFNFAPEFGQSKLFYHLAAHPNLALSVLLFTVLLYTQLIASGGFNLVHNSVAFVSSFTLALIIISFKVDFQYINTNGTSFNVFYMKIVQKSKEIFGLEQDADFQKLLTLLAQLAFRIILALLVARIALTKVSALWFNTDIVSRSTEYVPDKSTDETLSIKKQLGKKKKGVQFKKVLKVNKKPIDGNFSFLQDICNIVTLMLVMQSKVENAGLFVVFFAIREVVTLVIARKVQSEVSKRIEECDNNIMFTKLKLIFEDKLHLKLTFWVTFQTILLSNLSFFQFAFTNSLSTVDLANAYNGVERYNLILVGVLTFVSNFAPVVYWTFNSLVWTFDNELVNNSNSDTGGAIFFKKIKYDVLYVRILTNLCFYTVFGVCLAIACFSLRYHLFIWTVFSPKLLFFAVWNFLISGLLEVVVGALVALY